MKIISERSCIIDVSKRWDAQNPPNSCSKGKKKIGDILRSIDLKTATADDIEKIIGNRSWSQPETCSECGKEDVTTIQLGQEPDYKSRTAWICEECIKKALLMFEKEKTEAVADMEELEKAINNLSYCLAGFPKTGYLSLDFGAREMKAQEINSLLTSLVDCELTKQELNQ